MPRKKATLRPYRLSFLALELHVLIVNTHFVSLFIQHELREYPKAGARQS